MYVKDCQVDNLSDNGISLVASTDGIGCQNCTVDGCNLTNIGNTGLMNTGGNNNQFVNCQVNNSRGAAGVVYNTNGNITYDSCTFTNANNSDTKTPSNDEFLTVTLALVLPASTDIPNAAPE